MQMSASIWPLPGGIENYEDTLRQMLQLCWEPIPIDQYVAALIEKYPTVSSVRTARSYVYNVLGVLGFADIDRGIVVASATGRSYVETSDPALIESALRTRLTGVDELLEELKRQPRPISELLDAMRSRGFDWASDWQLRFRLRWLRVAGVVERRTERESAGRYPEWALVSRNRPEA